MNTDALLLSTATPSPLVGDRIPTDSELLGAFGKSHDSSAFDAIVRRHGPMVLGVCLRTLQHRQDAEDAFQVVFVVLAKRAGSICPPDKLAGWLYGVAHRTALKARSMRRKRQEKEAMWQNPAQCETTDPHWKDLAPIVDQELMRLPEQQRLALVLSVFEGQSKSEIATTLGVAEGTVSSRLARAREALRDRLARREIALAATAICASLASHARAAVAEGLIIQTTQTVAMAAAGAAGAAVPAGIAALTEGVLHAMFISKLKLIVAWVIAISVISTGSGIMIYSAVAKDAPAGKSEKPTAEPGNQVRGNIVSVEGDTITVGTVEDGQKVRKTVTLPADAAISLAPDSKGQDAIPGKREQLTPGSNVTITLDADGKTARAIAVMGRSAGGTLESVGKDKITVIKGKDIKQPTIYKVNENTTVILAWGKEKSDIQRGTVADLKPGMQVNISLSAADKDLARSITVVPQAPTPKGDKGAKEVK
jgi:RNA polymerase sigma factor (sigma-70 family)